MGTTVRAGIKGAPNVKDGDLLAATAKTAAFAFGKVIYSTDHMDFGHGPTAPTAMRIYQSAAL
jgi:hypothetical protein